MPSSLVLVGQVVPRSRSFATTLAPAMAAPDGSVTRPVMPALTSCAIIDETPRSAAAQISNRRLCIKPPFGRMESLYSRPSFKECKFAESLGYAGNVPPSCDRIVIRATNWLGDAVMSLPAIRAVREAYPKAHLAVLARPW